MIHDVWVEIDRSALQHNLAQVRRLVGGQVEVMAVVKANAYGHGYLEAARAFVEGGADSLAVTRLDEALILRKGGVKSPVLILAPIQPENAAEAVDADLDLTVSSIELARRISAAASEAGRTARVHVKLDTGMGRLGLLPDEVPSFFKAVAELPNLTIAGTFTHFANAADSDLTPARLQLELFSRIIAALKEMGFDYGVAHASNSAATVRLPGSRLNMVRPGTILYGQYPSRHVPHDLDLKPTWKLRARICEIKDLPAGSAVGYGSEYTTRRPTRVAIIPIGFADGFTLAPEGPVYRQDPLRFAIRRLRRKPSVRINGRQAPVLGRVAMQMIVVDVTSIRDVQVGSEADIPAMRIPTNPSLPRVSS